MAAPVVRGQGKVFQHICRKCRPSLQSNRHYAPMFYVLLPETPKDTAETNPVMRYGRLPEFSQINLKDVIKGGAKLSIEFETKLADHLSNLEDIRYPKTFDTVMKPIEEILVPLDHVWYTGRHLSYVRNNEEYDYRHAYLRAHRQIIEARQQRFIHDPLYAAIKEVAMDRDNLDEYQQRLVDWYIRECRMGGLDTHGKERADFYELVQRINKDKDDIRDKVILCAGLFNHQVEEMSIVEKLPKQLMYLMADYSVDYQRGPWTVTLYNPIYKEFLSHCNDRTTRWNCWHAKNNVCSHIWAGQHLNNNVAINDHRARRFVVAKELGYKNYAEVAVSRSMAGNLENVVSLLETLKTSLMDRARDEIAVIQEFANAEGFSGEIKNWDWDYWATQKAIDIIGLDTDGVAEYFPLTKVMEGMFNLCTRLFGIHFKANTDCDTWNDDVVVYDIVEEDGTYISTIYFDPYCRVGKRTGCWMETGAPSSKVMGVKPFSYLALNLMHPSVSGGPTVMTFGNVHELFSQFGHGLQQMLTKAPYSELSGQTHIELDTLHICSNFFEKWLTKPEILMSISSHVQTGKPLSEDLATRIIQGHGLLDGFNLVSEVFKSIFDLEVNVQDWKRGWHTIFTKLYPDYMPLPKEPWDYSPNSFTAIFGEGFTGCYYSFVWSQMVAADVLAAFEEAGLDNDEAVAFVGKRFRDTLLSYGAAVSPNENFRRFRGRDPSVEALLLQYK